MQDEELRKSGEIHSITTLDYPELQTMDHVRRQVIQVVSHYEDAEITADWVLARLRAQPGLNIPWKNPKAVISTILLRSGRWKKKEKGVFIKVTEEEKE